MNGRWLALTGLVSVVLGVVAFLVAGEPPDVDAPGREVTSFYDENSGEQQAAAGLTLLSAVFLVFFAGAVRAVLRPAEPGPGTLSAVGFGGGLLVATGLGLFATITFALTDEPESIQPAAAQALHVLSIDAFGPLAIGVATFLLANGILIARGAALPRWLGWIAIVLGVLAATPLGFFAFLGFLAWSLLTSLLLLLRAGREHPERAEAPPA